MVDWVAGMSSSRGRSVQPLLRFVRCTNSGALLTNYAWIPTRSPKEKKPRQETVENIFIFVHIFAWETCAIIKEHVTGVYELQIKESLVEANSELYGHFNFANATIVC